MKACLWGGITCVYICNVITYTVHILFFQNYTFSFIFSNFSRCLKTFQVNKSGKVIVLNCFFGLEKYKFAFIEFLIDSNIYNILIGLN